MNIVVVGAGAIGKERIKTLTKLGENIVAVVDSAYSDITILDTLSLNPDWFFICIPHDESLELTELIINCGYPVLVEKPLGRTIKEYDSYGFSPLDKINVGFNYRFYKGVRQLLTDCQNGLFGDLVSVNMVLALGDAPGTEKTWRLDPLRAGWGAMLDPGIHLIDLAMLISNGTLEYVSGVSNSKFWNTGFVEECHYLASDLNNVVYNIQASKCRWRNAFRIEVNGTDGYGIVEGRNRNYGNQTYIRGKRWGWQSGKSQKESEELVIDYDGEDSFYEETKAVLYGCEGIQPATVEDNRRCLKFIG